MYQSLLPCRNRMLRYVLAGSDIKQIVEQYHFQRWHFGWSAKSLSTVGALMGLMCNFEVVSCVTCPVCVLCCRSYSVLQVRAILELSCRLMHVFQTANTCLHQLQYQYVSLGEDLWPFSCSIEFASYRYWQMILFQWVQWVGSCRDPYPHSVNQRK